MRAAYLPQDRSHRRKRRRAFERPIILCPNRVLSRKRRVSSQHDNAVPRAAIETASRGWAAICQQQHLANRHPVYAGSTHQVHGRKYTRMKGDAAPANQEPSKVSRLGCTFDDVSCPFEVGILQRSPKQSPQLRRRQPPLHARNQFRRLNHKSETNRGDRRTCTPYRHRKSLSVRDLPLLETFSAQTARPPFAFSS